MSAKCNQQRYESEHVVDYYKKLNRLQACERHIFDRHLVPGMAILDIGVGAGRTTPYLSSVAGRYVGADYSEAMVAACRKAWHELEFRHCDATDMAQFGDGEFDAVVFSFNGIDEIPDSISRGRCLAEIARILRPGGIFIFSSHNAKALGLLPKFSDAAPHQIAWRSIRAIFKSVNITCRHLTSGVFSAGQGYLRDPVHGGLYRYASTPETMRPQLTQVGLHEIELISSLYPIESPIYLVPWYYYACRKQT